MKWIMYYLKYSFLHSAKYSFMIVMQTIIEGILPSIQVLALASFISKIEDVLTLKYSIISIVPTLLFFLLIVFLEGMIQQVTVFINEKHIGKLRTTVTPKIVEKIATIEYRYLEDETSLDIIKRVSNKPEEAIAGGFKLILNMIKIFIRFIGLIAIIASISVWYGLIITLINVPFILISIKSGKVIYNVDKSVTASIRKHQYYHDLIVGREAASERFVFDFVDVVKGDWKKEYSNTCGLQLKAFLEYFIKIRLYGVGALILTLLMIGILIKPVVNQEMSLGLFIGIVTNLLMIVSIIIQQISHIVSEITKKIEYIKEFDTVLKLDEDEDEVLSENNYNNINIKKIEFRNVTFKYPGTAHTILNHVSFVIEHGKVYGFVGENGAGKTTIVKLITGLYKNYEGGIYFDGVELRQIHSSKLKNYFSVVYQDFAKYHVNISDNIAPHGIKNSNDYLKLKKVIRKVGLSKFVDGLPKKEKTVIGKFDENNIELSLGQWQKIAIARAIYKDAPIYVLDEPTASLDPDSEYQLYSQYGEICKGKTTILISHRLASVKKADTIFIFSNGSIVEKGDFHQLMRNENLFYSMYMKQRSWYA